MARLFFVVVLLERRAPGYIRAAAPVFCLRIGFGRKVDPLFGPMLWLLFPALVEFRIVNSIRLLISLKKPVVNRAGCLVASVIGPPDRKNDNGPEAASGDGLESTGECLFDEWLRSVGLPAGPDNLGAAPTGSSPVAQGGGPVAVLQGQLVL
ncbi:hypothetical protein KL86PLE_100651 [uncultured Pleomorphomonas sp.]|uniref:Uncharacterized protein n=1 Tax=uncultured Pleomorphomonas sp. TaxID=442121 RepID=A0A212L530_9HYPH|nr:hypothetical protein KL86PLE_100651 [uncultured Pleomorphomonas sp.]